MTSLNKNVQY